ncbi:5552_t:CDS:2, partial [Gigaspora margarita]
GPSGTEESFACSDSCVAAKKFVCDNLYGTIDDDFHIVKKSFVYGSLCSAEKSFVHNNLCGTEESFVSGDFHNAKESSFCDDFYGAEKYSFCDDYYSANYFALSPNYVTEGQPLTKFQENKNSTGYENITKAKNELSHPIAVGMDFKS